MPLVNRVVRRVGYSESMSLYLPRFPAYLGALRFLFFSVNAASTCDACATWNGLPLTFRM